VNNTEIVRAFALCTSAYGRRFSLPTDEGELCQMVADWTRLLADVPGPVGLAAFDLHCQSNPHPPTPADIRSAATIHSALPSPGEAWAEVIHAAKHIGYQDGVVPEMSRPEIQDAACAAGWSAICFADTEMSLSTTRAHFFRIYDGMASRSDREQKRAALEGHVPAGLLPRLKRVDGIGKSRQIEAA